MKDQIKVGVASFGMSGKVFHCPLLASNDGFKISRILERSHNKSAEIYPYAVISRTYEELIGDPEIELIIVNTPDHLHVDMATAALEKGKHVIVEKPFTITSEEGQKLIDLAKSKGKMLSVFQNRRWDGDFLTVKKLINNKLVGRLVEFESHYDRYRNFIQENTWKEEEGAGTGILYNLGSHMIDQALVLFGMPNAVNSDLRITRTGGKVIDNYEIRMDYDNLKVLLKSGYLVREAGPRYTCHGTLGSFTKYGIDPQEDMLKAGFLPVGDDWGTENEEDYGWLNTEVGGLHVEGQVETIPGSYQDYYQNIYEVIRENKPLEVKPEESLNVIKIIEMAQESHNQKKTIIL
ncbi:MAG: oxidoreductase [Flammeovirgaceae bacterium]|nr:oxidoreductase [Flammeovirgaceae bacterium]